MEFPSETSPANVTASQFFRLFFDNLARAGIPAVILHSYQKLPEQIDSDVDYAVRDADVFAAQDILIATATATGWLIVQTLQYDIASYYSVLVNPELPGVFLKLDRCSHYTRNGCLFIPDESLLENRQRFNGLPIPAPAVEFIYTLAKVFAKKKGIDSYLPRLRELSAADPVGTEKLFHAVFGSEAGPLSAWLAKPPAAWYALSVPMHARNRYPLTLRLREGRRRLRRLLHPTGLRVLLLAKESPRLDDIISPLLPLLEPMFRRQLQLPFAAQTFITYWRQQWPAYRRSTCIILTAATPGEKVAGWANHFVPKPDLRFVLPSEMEDALFAVEIWRAVVEFLAKRERKQWQSLRVKFNLV